MSACTSTSASFRVAVFLRRPLVGGLLGFVERRDVVRRLREQRALELAALRHLGDDGLGTASGTPESPGTDTVQRRRNAIMRLISANLSTIEDSVFPRPHRRVRRPSSQRSCHHPRSGEQACERPAPSRVRRGRAPTPGEWLHSGARCLRSGSRRGARLGSGSPAGHGAGGVAPRRRPGLIVAMADSPCRAAPRGSTRPRCGSIQASNKARTGPAR